MQKFLGFLVISLLMASAFACGTTTTTDTTAPTSPTVSVTSPTNDTTPTFSWTAGGGGNGTYRYSTDESVWTETTDIFYTPATALSEGDTTLYVQERDDASNWSASGSATVTVDTTAPTTTVSPAGGTYSSAQSVSLSCDESGSTIYYTTDGSTPTASSPKRFWKVGGITELEGSTKAIWFVDSEGLPVEAVYSSAISISSDTTLQFFCVDEAGNSESVNTETYVIDTTSPTAAMTYGASAQEYKSGATDTFTATFTEAVSSSSISSTCTGGVTGISSTAMSGSGTSWTYSFTAETGDGTCTISLSASDSAGNAVSSVSGNTYTVDNTAPNAPTVTTLNSVSYDPFGVWIITTSSVTIGGTCSSSATSFTSDVGTVSFTSPNWTVAYDVPTDGNTYTPTFKCVDTAGNASSAATFAGIKYSAL